MARMQTGLVLLREAGHDAGPAPVKVAVDLAGLRCDLSRHGAAGRDPRVRLTGRSGDVLEIGVVVQHHRAVVLGRGCGQQADHPGRAVMPPRGHPDLHLACPVRDDLADRQDDVEFFAALGDRPRIAEAAAR